LAVSQNSELDLFYWSKHFKTRSQAVGRIANRTASQHLNLESRDIIGHVTIW